MHSTTLSFQHSLAGVIPSFFKFCYSITDEDLWIETYGSHHSNFVLQIEKKIFIFLWEISFCLWEEKVGFLIFILIFKSFIFLKKKLNSASCLLNVDHFITIQWKLSQYANFPLLKKRCSLSSKVLLHRKYRFYSVLTYQLYKAPPPHSGMHNINLVLFIFCQFGLFVYLFILCLLLLLFLYFSFSNHYI